MGKLDTAFVNAIEAKQKAESITVLEKSINLFNKDLATSGKYINATDGKELSLAGYYASEYIPVSSGDVLKSTVVSMRAVYDANKTFVSGVNSDSITVPTNGSFIRVSVKTENIDTFMLVKGSTLPNEYISPNPTTYLQSKIIVTKENTNFFKEQKTINLFNKNNAISGKYIIDTNGQLGTLSNYYASEWIPIKPNTTLKSSNSSSRAFYDINKNYISGANTNTLTAPSNAAFIRISVKDTNLNSTMLVESNILPTTFIPYSAGDVLNGVKVNYDDVLDLPKKSWSGKKWVAIGDSITEYRWQDENGITLNWSEDVAERLKVSSLKRCAQEGQQMHEIPAIMAYSGTTEQDLTDADLITVSLGQNDRTNSLGSPSDSASSDGSNFAGSTKYVIEYLLGLNPNCTIVFITPTPSVDRQSRLTQQADIIKGVCELYSIPVFDMNRKCGFNTYNFEHFYQDGTVHPNGIGYRRMGRLTAKYLENL